MLDTAFAPWPCYSEDEIQAVAEVLRSNRVNYWTGQAGRGFEQEFAAWCGTDHAVAVANGTVALELALTALDIGAGDEVIVAPRTFIASVSAVVNVGAKPVFADVDFDTGNISARTIQALVSDRTKAVMPVHLGGLPCDMGPIMDLAAANEFFVVEDCAQAHGARYRGRSVGTIGHVGAWSFCQDKIMTTGGEGGMVTTNDKELWSRMWSLKDHGKSWTLAHKKEHPPGFRWLHESIGTNWRITEMQAAIGRLQIRKISGWSRQRAENAHALLQALKPFASEGGVIRAPELDDSAGSVHAFYKLYAYVRAENLKMGWTRDRIIDEITLRGVPCYQGICPEVYLEKAFDNLGVRPQTRLPIAKALGETSLMFLVHPTLRPEDIEKTQNVIHEVLSMAGS